MRRAVVLGGAAMLGVAGIGLVLNWTGQAPIPFGPLGPRVEGSDTAWFTIPYTPEAEPLYLVPYVENHGPVPVVVEAVVPAGLSDPGALEVLGSLPFDKADPAQLLEDGTHALTGFVGPDPGAGWVAPGPVAGAVVDPVPDGTRAGQAFLVRITPDPDHEIHLDRINVEYSIGPFRFVTSAMSGTGTGFTMCPEDLPVADDGCQAAP